MTGSVMPQPEVPAAPDVPKESSAHVSPVDSDNLPLHQPHDIFATFSTVPDLVPGSAAPLALPPHGSALSMTTCLPISDATTSSISRGTLVARVKTAALRELDLLGCGILSVLTLIHGIIVSALCMIWRLAVRAQLQLTIALVIAIIAYGILGLWSYGVTTACSTPVFRPLSSYLIPCARIFPPVDSGEPYPRVGAVERADYSSYMAFHVEVFEKLVDQESTGVSALAYKVDQAQEIVRKVIPLVRDSELRSRHNMERVLQRFVSDASNTSLSLLEFDGCVTEKLDDLDRHNTALVKRIRDAEAASNSLFGIVLGWLLQWYATKTSQAHALVLYEFERSIGVSLQHFYDLVAQAEVAHWQLHALREQIGQLEAIHVEENKALAHEKQALMDSFWTWLGGNKGRLRLTDEQLGLLRGLSTYQDDAMRCILGALRHLRVVTRDLRKLYRLARKKDPLPGAARFDPAEQLGAINAGISRLQKLREKALDSTLPVED